MKGNLTKLAVALTVTSMLGACSSMTKGPQVVEEFSMPKWAEKCKQEGSEGGFLFWGGTDMVYSCGHGVSPESTLSLKAAKALAYDGVAERIRSVVDSNTTIDITDSSNNKRTTIKHSVDKTVIRNQLESEKHVQIYGGDYHTFVQIKMKKSDYEALVSEAKANHAKKTRN